ncbi:DUF1641 domain-containing protein [Thermodesulfobacteriota bacterium]
MTNEELILERLDRIESQLAPLSGSVESIQELRDDLTPLANNAFQLIIRELEDVESSCNLEDFLELIKRFLRSTRSITYSLKQLENIIDFITTLEPLLRSSVPKLINYLDELEQKGVFRMLMATLEIRAKVAEAYTSEDIDQIGDGFVALLGVAKKLSDPQIITFLERFTEVPACLDLETCKEVGPFGLLWASGNKEVKEGLGVLIELAKGMGRLKPQS